MQVLSTIIIIELEISNFFYRYFEIRYHYKNLKQLKKLYEISPKLLKKNISFFVCLGQFSILLLNYLILKNTNFQLKITVEYTHQKSNCHSQIILLDI